MNKKIKILHLEDSLKDSEFIHALLESEGMAHDYFLADNEKDFINILDTEKIDIILCDYNLPGYDGNEALRVAKEKYFHIPFIFVSGAIGEDAAIYAMLNGATDYVLKNKLERLIPAIKRALHEFELEHERKQAEDALRISENKFRSYIEFMPDGIFVLNENGTFLEVNNAASKITGYSESELLTMTNTDLLPSVSLELAGTLFSKTISAGRAVGEFLYRHKNGNYRLWSAEAVKLPNARILEFVRDVTERKQELYARSLIEASLDPLVTINVEGKIMDMNEAMANITGVERRKLIGSDFFDYFTEPVKAREVYREVFSKGFVADYPLTILDHKLTGVLFNGSVYKDDRGNVMGAVVVARDITVQKKIEKELIEARVFAELATLIAEEEKNKAESATRIAENAVKAKQQFLSNMSHEIRTPMNAIIGFTKVLLKTDLSSKQNEYLTAIKMSGDALIVLINDILDLAKVEAGKMTFELIPFKMAMSISAMLHLFETKIQEKNLEFVKEYDNKIPEVLAGDPVRLHQIILNLVSNAVKFTNKGKITVCVRLLSEDDEKATIEFSVTDTGIGISENKIPDIFETFRQASSATARLYGGTGLGLSIVKQLVEQQGGTVSVKSKIDEGSVFGFILSFMKTDANADTAAELETGIFELDAEIKNIKVLVVEDIALNQLLMKTLLDDFGFERDIAANGKIAIEKLQAKSYDIILMDLQMPEMNGFEATEYIRGKMNSKIPIIALTADVTTVDLAKCRAVGMNDYIAKPVDEKLLYSKIIGLVKKPNLVKFIEEKVIAQDLSKKIKCIDLSYLNRRTKSDPKLMMEMISLYLEQTPPLVIAMKQSFHEKNWSLLHAAVHKMIPSFSIMGISADFENKAKQIKEYATTQQRTEGMPDLVLQLEKACNQACIELEEEFNLIKNAN